MLLFVLSALAVPPVETAVATPSALAPTGLLQNDVPAATLLASTWMVGPLPPDAPPVDPELGRLECAFDAVVGPGGDVLSVTPRECDPRLLDSAAGAARKWSYGRAETPERRTTLVVTLVPLGSPIAGLHARMRPVNQSQLTATLAVPPKYPKAVWGLPTPPECTVRVVLDEAGRPVSAVPTRCDPLVRDATVRSVLSSRWQGLTADDGPVSAAFDRTVRFVIQ